MNLWSENTPGKFWQLLDEIPSDIWESAVQTALPNLAVPLLEEGIDIDTILETTLGEGQFGANHWRLSTAKRLYYHLKPLMPRALTRLMRQAYSESTRKEFQLAWPIENRFVDFFEETLRQALIMREKLTVGFVHFWPKGYRYALVLTHDIETAAGQAQVRRLAEMETELGFRSSFNFIPERYPLDYGLMDWLRRNGFEIGVHGLKHDGKLFLGYNEFQRRAHRINAYLKEFGAVGFRAPLTHRQPQWMQKLDIVYDASFFDTDPFEPISGGTMTIWPFFLGRFVELPYTLVQDYSLMKILEEKSDRIWLEKTDFIRDHCGMALINTHPDYLVQTEYWSIYESFLKAQALRGDCWSTLPREAAAWWRKRAEAVNLRDLPEGTEGTIALDGNTGSLIITS